MDEPAKPANFVVVNPPDGPFIKYPPFPTPPPGVTIIPFKHFKERGIQIFSDTDIEVDGLGIPTVELRVPHETDECKTETKRKGAGSKKEPRKSKKTRKAGDEGEESKKEEEEGAKGVKEKIPRYILFAKREWYDVWAEGEDLRVAKSYNPNLTAMDRIHIAATDFRVGRPWPPARLRLGYLWDQFRLYAGLLGSTPVWVRTDRPQSEGDDEVEDEDDDDEAELESPVYMSGLRRSRDSHHPQTSQNKKVATDDEYEGDDDLPDFGDSEPIKDEFKSPAEGSNAPPPPQRKKRIPPRTPYALYNVAPVPVSSDDEVRVLLARAAAHKEARLFKFLEDIEGSIKVFLGWWLRKEGLVWSPHHLPMLPRLISFFLSFLIRAGALPESDRALKRALDVADKAIVELPRTGALCRVLPDKLGKGGQACWGQRGKLDDWNFGCGTEGNNSGEVQDEENRGDPDAMKKFEEELKAANMQIIDADKLDHLGGVVTRRGGGVDVFDEGGGVGQTRAFAHEVVANEGAEIGIEVLSPTSPGPSFTQATSITEVIDAEVQLQIPTTPTEKETRFPFPPSQDRQGNADRTISGPAHTADAPNWALAPDPEPPVSSMEEEDPRAWALPVALTNDQKHAAAQAQNDAWVVAPTQAIIALLGMTLLPLQYEAGQAERSIRRVKAVLKAGERVGKVRGVDEDLEKRLARVILEPWSNWDDGGVAPEYRTPKLFPATSSEDSGEGQHDPGSDEITVLMEPYAASMVCIGMGLAGTWVQLAPVRSSSGYNRGGRGRGRGRARGGSNAGGGSSHPAKNPSYWYVEDIYMAVPSFWTVGQDEEVDGGADGENELPSDLED